MSKLLLIAQGKSSESLNINNEPDEEIQLNHSQSFSKNYCTNQSGPSNSSGMLIEPNLPSFPEEFH